MENTSKRGRKLNKKDPYIEKIRLKLNDIRTEKGISQKDVADSAGLSNAAYSNIEAGNSQNITIKAGVGIAKALNMSFTKLFEIEDSGSEKTELIKQISDLEQECNAIKDQNENYELVIKLFKNEKIRISRDVAFFLEETIDFQDSYINQISSLSSFEKREIFNNIFKTLKIFAKGRFVDTGVITMKELDEIIPKYKSIVRPADIKGEE